MKEIRKGNDIVVTWSLKREGQPFVLEGLSLTLYLKSMYDKKPLSDYSVSGNKIIWTFYGKDQNHTGNYSLELVVNKDEKGMMTTDACNFVRIVSCSCRTSNGWDDCGIKTEIVDIESEVEYGGSIIVVDKVLSPDSENAIANNAVYREFGKYTTTEELGDQLSNKVDKESGKGLSTEDFTTALKNKLNSLSNYDDKELSEAVATLRKDLDNLVSGDTTTAIKTFNEIIAFLDGIQDTESLDSIIASIEQQIEGKQDKLVSGTNIKTINGKSILGEGNIEIEGGEGSYDDTEIKRQLTELEEEIEQLNRGEAYIMGDTLTFRNWADASIEGETLKL